MDKEKTQMNELCPFCGDRRAKTDTLNYTNSGKPGRFRVQCQDCGATTRWYDTEEQAWAAWNNRYIKLSPELEVFIFNSDAFVYEGLLYVRNKQSGYCFAQKEFRGALKRIKKSDFLSAAHNAAAAQAERAIRSAKKNLKAGVDQ
jgi:Lar family restriction alleviation protein